MSDDRYSEALREAMEAVPVSRRELARRAGLSHTTLNAIASGQQQATASIVEAVGSAIIDLGVDMTEARQALRKVGKAARQELQRQREGSNE